MVKLKTDFPDDFFQEEIRENYTISSKEKEVWAVTLDLLIEFDRVCKKNSISYCLDSGTLLGAIRHKGFIPWDNDIDVIMLRSEFEKLRKIAPTEFEAPYFFQSFETDKGYYRGHAQLRNSETTGIIESEAGKKIQYNQGIFLDVFILDGIGNQEEYESQLKEKQRLISKLYFLTEYGKSPAKRVLKRIRNYFYEIITKTNADKVFMEYETLCQKYNDSEYVDKIMYRSNTRKLYRLKKEWFSNLIDWDFEGYIFPVPAEYHQILSLYYGENYMIPKQAAARHGDVIFDTSISYLEYGKANKR